MPPDQTERLYRELHATRKELAVANRELRQEMRDSFARIEMRMNARFDDHEGRLRELEIERGRFTGIMTAIAAIAGGLSGWIARLFSNE